jgi:hypothetical protein
VERLWQQPDQIAKGDLRVIWMDAQRQWHIVEVHHDPVMILRREHIERTAHVPDAADRIASDHHLVRAVIEANQHGRQIEQIIQWELPHVERIGVIVSALANCTVGCAEQPFGHHRILWEADGQRGDEISHSLSNVFHEFTHASRSLRRNSVFLREGRKNFGPA